jgi:hypothetical protein
VVITCWSFATAGPAGVSDAVVSFSVTVVVVVSSSPPHPMKAVRTTSRTSANATRQMVISDLVTS